MATSDPKADLRRYLQQARDAMLWKLEGLPEYQIRRPLVRTGTNLLGLVKHLTGVEFGYFGDTFGRPYPGPLPPALTDPDTEDSDMFATPGESRELITGLYREAWAHADVTLDALDLDATGQVLAETHRHAGHADIIRELIDGSAGDRPNTPNIPADLSPSFWVEYRDRVERAAKEAGAQDR
jgi:hypothetical protein